MSGTINKINKNIGKEKYDTSNNILQKLFEKPWIWAFCSALATYLITMIISGGQGASSLLYTAMTFGAFAAIVGMGQVLVITLGPGNVDLSIPATMTLAATISLKLMDSQPDMALAGLAVALGVGLLCGIGNFVLIILLRIPPIIATLSASFLYQSLAIWSNRGLRIKPPQELADFTTSGLFGIPNVAIVGIAVAVLVWFLLEYAILGRWILAIGQNLRAAQLSGIPINCVRCSVYVACAVLASLAGFLLANFSGGASLNMGTEYMLMSIAVVVIGGSSIAGGDSNIPGIWGASLFMFLVVSMLNSYGFGAGIRLILTGVIIVSIITLASKSRRII